jgi:nicotinate-nucleotide--dimethylbenzimidazole phosphoribosyltransferase
MAVSVDGSEDPSENTPDTPVDDGAAEVAAAMRRHIDALTKPLGSLGRLEHLATKLATIQGRVPPYVERKSVVVCAADHGIAAEGVSAHGPDVSEQMVRAVAGGSAPISILSRATGFDLTVVDCGLRRSLGLPEVRELRVGPGTASFRSKPALTHDQLFRCIENGRDLAGEIGGAGITPGADIVALGDIGVGNTSAAAAMAMALGASEDVIDRGTGISDDVLAYKRRVITEAVKRHSPFSNAYDVLRKVGGFEFATLVGIILGLRHRGVAVVLDGFPAAVAAYVAMDIDSNVTSFLFAGHRSRPKGHRILLDLMGLEPILDLELHLGEGTGAVLGGFQVDLAARLASEMQTGGAANGVDSDGNAEGANGATP